MLLLNIHTSKLFDYKDLLLQIEKGLVILNSWGAFANNSYSPMHHKTLP